MASINKPWKLYQMSSIVVHLSKKEFLSMRLFSMVYFVCRFWKLNGYFCHFSLLLFFFSFQCLWYHTLVFLFSLIDLALIFNAKTLLQYRCTCTSFCWIKGPLVTDKYVSPIYLSCSSFSSCLYCHLFISSFILKFLPGSLSWNG